MKHSQNDLLEAHFRAHPNEWLDPGWRNHLGKLWQIGAAVHSRISDLRKRGMDIENRTHLATEEGRTFTVSQYRFNNSPSRICGETQENASVVVGVSACATPENPVKSSGNTRPAHAFLQTVLL